MPQSRRLIPPQRQTHAPKTSGVRCLFVVMIRTSLHKVMFFCCCDNKKIAPRPDRDESPGTGVRATGSAHAGGRLSFGRLASGSSAFDTHNILTNGSRLVLDVKSELNGSRKGQHMANYYNNGSRFGQNLQFCQVKSTFWAQN